MVPKRAKKIGDLLAMVKNSYERNWHEQQEYDEKQFP